MKPRLYINLQLVLETYVVTQKDKWCRAVITDEAI